MLPRFLLMFALTWVYVTFGITGVVKAIFYYGVQSPSWRSSSGPPNASAGTRSVLELVLDRTKAVEDVNEVR